MKNSLIRLTLGIALLVIAQPAAALTLDFSDVGLSHGSIVTSSQGVTITTTNTGGGPDMGVVFDTNRSGTADSDLERGSGWSGGNLAPNTDLGLALIIQEHSGSCGAVSCSNPDDEGSRPAGSFALDFSSLGSFQNFSMDLIDVESITAEPGSVVFRNGGAEVANRSFMSFLSQPGVAWGDNSANRILDIVAGVEFDEVIINMGGSGAVDNVTVSNPVPEPTSALLFGLGIVAAGRGIRRR